MARGGVASGTTGEPAGSMAGAHGVANGATGLVHGLADGAGSVVAGGQVNGSIQVVGMAAAPLLKWLNQLPVGMTNSCGQMLLAYLICSTTRTSKGSWKKHKLTQ